MKAKATKTRRTKKPKDRAGDSGYEGGLLIGVQLKHARLNRRINLRQLADDVGCTESFLSKVENDKVRPSLTMLHNIVKALGINVAKLFSEPGSPTVTVLKAGKRVTFKMEQAALGRGITLESLLPIPLSVLLEANIHHVEPGASTNGFIEHKGEEMGFVLKGTLEVTVDGRTVTVEKGDSFFFQSHLPHGYRNSGTTTAQILWVNTPQSF